DAVFEMALELRARCINLVEPFGVPVGVDEGAACFARVCDRARPLGLVVLLEAMPFSGIPTLAHAWSIVQRADRPNAALTVDLWHVLRGGVDPLLLSQIPGDRVGTVQIADGAADPGEDLLADLYRRLLPGDGALPLRPLLEGLHRMDALTNVGVEVFGPALSSLSPEEIGRRSRRALELALQGLGRSG
ncbi:MAG: sugar phosphate isomerase/epimerase, partial [Deltaproteobacteria bacterium]|nr:sugar phosphate isomerase/epimerase [Nannocystaceae bacterium]